MPIYNNANKDIYRNLNLNTMADDEFIQSSYTFPADAVNPTTSDVIEMFPYGVLENLTVTGWEVFMEPVDLGVASGATVIKRTDEATIAAGSPGVINWIAHGLQAGAKLRATFASGTLPPEVALNTDYYVVSPTTNAFSIATTSGGAAIALTGTPTGIVALIASTLATRYDVKFNIGVGSSSGVSGTDGYLWAQNTDKLGRNNLGNSVLRHENGNHLRKNGGSLGVYIQPTTLPANPSWAGKRIVMVLRICAAGLI